MYIYFNECYSISGLFLLKYSSQPVCRLQFLGGGPELGINEVSRLHQERHLLASKSHQDAFGSLDT